MSEAEATVAAEATGKTEEPATPAPAAEAAAEGDDAGTEGKSEEKARKKRWLPLESNPAVMNKYIQGLGFPTPMFSFVDVLSTDDWALGMVPSPVEAVMLLFPIKEASEKHKDEEAARIASEGQVVSENLYYTKQTVGNACGTVGLIHAVANASKEIPITEGSFFESFLKRTKDMTPDERAAAMEADEALDAAQDVATREGQTAVPDLDDRIDAHFICFVHQDGHLYELDGRKASPVNHGECSKGTLLEKAVEVIKQFMARDAGEVRFAITALAPTMD